MYLLILFPHSLNGIFNLEIKNSMDKEIKHKIYVLHVHQNLAKELLRLTYPVCFDHSIPVYVHCLLLAVGALLADLDHTAGILKKFKQEF